ncbi:MAG TPA: EcsC family protein [Desulfitobacteriaceae bacterium]|nr:EcsC family protein [Desulfitobacteriaceae bacterium]
METYQEKVKQELQQWQKKMLKKPSISSKLTNGLQTKFNDLIPDKVQAAFTFAISNMTKAVLLGSEYTTRKSVLYQGSLEERDKSCREKLAFYRKAALTTGAGTGAGGIFLGLADFPLLLGLKIKFLFEAARIYGFDVKDIRERIYILTLFQLAFSSAQKRAVVFRRIVNWDEYLQEFPPDLKSFDWHTFQQEYRDYIDLAKMLQLVPGIGAFVGAYANYKLMDKLGEAAINSYRLRILQKKIDHHIEI